MISVIVTLHKWLMVLIMTLSILNTKTVMAKPSPQITAPVQPQPTFSFPMSMGIGIAVVQEEKALTTTTTTTAKPFIDEHGGFNVPGGIDNIAIALSVPQLPMGVPPAMSFNMGMPMGFGIAIVQNEVTSTTTTTAKPYTDKNLPGSGSVKDIAVALPMPSMSIPIPMGQPVPAPGILAPQPVQFAVPGVIPTFCKKDKRHPSCPPCPPCSCQPCTPSFFSYCSPCHQKCRCKNSNDVPIPLPPSPPVPLPGPAFPMPFPMSFPMASISSPQVVIIPYPPEMAPPRRRKYPDYSCEKHTLEDTDESSDCNGNDSSYHYSSRKKKNKLYINNGIYERRSGVISSRSEIKKDYKIE